MSEEAQELAEFGFGIKLIRNTDEKLEFKMQSVNTCIIKEVVITQMKAFLKDLEINYFN